MELQLDNTGERQTVTVDNHGRIYIGTKYIGETVEVGFEVQE
jgi:hypothetical protein